MFLIVKSEHYDFQFIGRCNRKNDVLCPVTTEMAAAGAIPDELVKLAS